MAELEALADQGNMTSGYRIAILAMTLGGAVAASPAAASDVGRRFPAERQVFVDRTTGFTLTALTTGPANDGKIYQTHPQWAADGVHVIFHAEDRSADGHPQAFAVNEITGAIVQLTDGPGVDTTSLNVARKTNRLYYLRRVDGRTQLMAVDLDALLSGAAVDPEPERLVAVLPPEYRGQGGFTLDADEEVAYFGINRSEAPRRDPGQPLPQVPGGIRVVDLQTGHYGEVIDTPFRVGHVQANPWRSGEILYCNETGGDAPQRMWIVKADGSGNRPLFEEAAHDFVTHELFVDSDHVMFNLIGRPLEQRTRPSGIAVVSLQDGGVEFVGQVAGAGFWHSAGTADGHWAAGDTFDGEIYLIDRRNGERMLLSAGHSGHAHQSFSPDGTRLLIQSGLLSGGKSLDLFIINIAAANRH